MAIAAGLSLGLTGGLVAGVAQAQPSELNPATTTPEQVATSVNVSAATVSSIAASSIPVAPAADQSETVTQTQTPAATSAVPPVKLSYEKNAGNTGSQLMTVALSLALIITLIYGLSLFVRRFGQGVGYGNSQIKVVASMAVGTRERLSVVDVGGQQILIGVTATQINTLHVFDTPVIESQTQSPSDFAQKFKAILSSQSATATRGGES